MADNEFRAGDQFCADFWVYQGGVFDPATGLNTGGVRVRKWYTVLPGLERFWPGHYADSPRIERLYRAYERRLDYAWQRVQRAAQDVLGEYTRIVVGLRSPRQGHVTPMRLEREGAEVAIVYPVDEAPCEPHRATPFVYAYRYWCDVVRRASVAKRVWEEALQRAVREVHLAAGTPPDWRGVPVRARVNGRDYWSVLAHGPFGALLVKRLAWEGDRVIDVAMPGVPRGEETEDEG